MKRKILLLLIGLSIALFSVAQQGIVSGVLLEEGLPLPRDTVTVKGTENGTLTDIDGAYRIECSVGDILKSMQTREVLVTPVMLEGVAVDSYSEVYSIKSEAYGKAIKKLNQGRDSVPDIGDSKRTYNKNNNSTYFDFQRIKEIEIQDEKVKLTYFKPDIYYEAGYNSSLGVQFVRGSNLPELQHSFSQGASSSGELTFQGAETGNVFSYGPALNALEFNGGQYLYDTNGLLVNRGSGNGAPANAYDNALFENVWVNSNHLFFKASTDSELLGFDFSNVNAKDIYNRERSLHNSFSLNYKKRKRENKMGWQAFLTYQSQKDNQPNLNGFHNNLLLNLWATPPSFSNQQGAVLPDNTQRRFATQYNNPEWLLDNNQNSIGNKSFAASVQNEIDLGEIILSAKFNYRYNDQEQKFGLMSGTAGFEDGFVSNKIIREHHLSTIGNFEYTKFNYDNEIRLKSIVNYSYGDLDFSLLESSVFAPFSYTNALNSIETNQSKSRSILRLRNQFNYKFNEKFEFEIVNKSYYSSIQNDKWFLPAVSVHTDLRELFDIYGIRRLLLSASASYDINDTPLYYRNLSHNSLLYAPQESLSYTANNNLFVDAAVRLEETENYEANLSFGIELGRSFIDGEFAYYYSKTNGSVFPIIRNGAFALDNVADIKKSGFELSVSSSLRLANSLSYTPKIVFSTYNTEVLRLLSDAERVPIAGFSTTSQNLIVGQPAGAIVGTAYQRNEQNAVVVGSDGFPLLNPSLQIIGDPTPDCNIGFNNSFEWKKFELNVLVDIQKGGDIWNGTQNVLNYLGTSQQSAEERGITQFVFNGVNQQGNASVVPVDFYNPNNSISENRFVRYGFEGVGEEAIADGSYLNIKSISVSYSFFDRNRGYGHNYPFFRNVQLGLYAKNLFTWTRFKGYSPYEALYGNASGRELHFFNTPLLSEVGLTLKVEL